MHFNNTNTVPLPPSTKFFRCLAIFFLDWHFSIVFSFIFRVCVFSFASSIFSPKAQFLFCISSSPLFISKANWNGRTKKIWCAQHIHISYYLMEKHEKHTRFITALRSVRKFCNKNGDDDAWILGADYFEMMMCIFLRTEIRCFTHCCWLYFRHKI